MWNLKCINLADILIAKIHKINSEINVNCNRKMAPNVRPPRLYYMVYYIVCEQMKQ